MQGFQTFDEVDRQFPMVCDCEGYAGYKIDVKHSFSKDTFPVSFSFNMTPFQHKSFSFSRLDPDEKTLNSP